MHTGTVGPTLKLHLILDYKRLTLVVDLLGKLRRDGMVGSLVLEDQTLVILNTLQHEGFLDLPVADVCPLFVGVGADIFLRIRGLPSCAPVIGELLK